MKAIFLAVAVVLAVFGFFTLLNMQQSSTLGTSTAKNPNDPQISVSNQIDTDQIDLSPTGRQDKTKLEGPVTPTPTKTPTTPTAAPTAVPYTKAVIATTKGDITVTLYPQDAPKTVANFAQKAESNFYKDLTFHRVEDWVIQGGDPLGNGTGGGKLDTELNKKPFVKGSLGVARGGDIKVSNDAQFFITKQEASWLNEQYTNFGIVTDGMDVVEKIAKGDRILSITVE